MAVSNTSLQDLSTKLDDLVRRINDEGGEGKLVRLDVTDEDIALLETMVKMASAFARLRKFGLYLLVAAGIIFTNYERVQGFLDKIFGGP